MVVLYFIWQHCSNKMLQNVVSLELTKPQTDILSAFKDRYRWGFPGGAVVKNPPANTGDTGSSPGPGRSHMPRSN